MWYLYQLLIVLCVVLGLIYRKQALYFICYSPLWIEESPGVIMNYKIAFDALFKIYLKQYDAEEKSLREINYIMKIELRVNV